MEKQPKDFFGNILKIGDIILYSNGTKPYEQGFSYGILKSFIEITPNWWGCYVTPIKNNKITRTERYRGAKNLIKCPNEYLPDLIICPNEYSPDLNN